SLNLDSTEIKDFTIFLYSIFSLISGLFAINFLALNISSNVYLDYLLLITFTIIWAPFTVIILKKNDFFNSHNLTRIGFIIPIGTIIDLLINKRINLWYLGIICIIFFYFLTYAISEK
ncbi:MAG: hypothetical protein ACOCUI_05825, partial [bacterium]